MTTLFIHADERHYLARWEYTTAVLRIVARDYCQVLAGDIPQDRHRTIMIQTGSDLLDIEADLGRLGVSSPADRLEPWVQAVWQALVPLVLELRTWRLPAPDMPIELIESALIRRKALEEQFNAVLRLGGSATPDAVRPTAVVTTTGR